MAKKGVKQSKGLIRKEPKVSAEVILSHPVFKDMASRLETVQRMLKDLPAAIGAAVSETMRKPPEGASGPPVPLVNPQTVEIHSGRLVLDGKTSITSDAKRIDKPRVIEKTLPQPAEADGTEKKEKWPPLDSGTKVKTYKPITAKRREWTDEGWAKRRWGVLGVIVDYHDSHGLYYDVQHEDGLVAGYDPSEFDVVPESSGKGITA